MDKKMFIALFIGIHVAFIFLQIHKQSYHIQQSFTKQKDEKRKQELIDKRNLLTQEWYTLQNRSRVKQYAHNELGMEKIKLSQIKQLPS